MKPAIKRELVIERHKFPNVLSIQMATPRAREWIEKEGCKYASTIHFSCNLSEVSSPVTDCTLIVSKCFDIEEVMQYLDNPKYEESTPIKIVKGAS